MTTPLSNHLSPAQRDRLLRSLLTGALVALPKRAAKLTESDQMAMGRAAEQDAERFILIGTCLVIQKRSGVVQSDPRVTVSIPAK